MYESSVIQHFAERGILQGQIRQGIEDVLDALEIRFGESAAKTLKPTVEGINDRQILRQLHRKAIGAVTLDEFKETFNSIVQNGS